jgi:hypothetical protein
VSVAKPALELSREDFSNDVKIFGVFDSARAATK